MSFFGSITGLDLLKGGLSLASGLLGSKSQSDANKANLQAARETNSTQLRIAQENNALQERLLKYNNEWNRQQAIDMFNLENAYNSPLAQVQRLREAGLNPAVMMEGAGGAAVGNSSAAAPTAASAGISPSLPSLTTPRVDAVPPMSVGFLNALQSFADIKLAEQQSRKVGQEADRITKLVDQELLNMMAEEKWKQSQTAYQDLMTQFEKLYGHDRRAADITKTVSEFVKNKLQGNEAAARTALAKAEADLTKTKDKQLQLESPILIENLKKLGVKLDEEAKTEKAKQAAAYAGAEESHARANLTRSEQRLLEEQHDDLVYARRLQNAKDFQELGEMATTWQYRLEELQNRKLISAEQVKEAREAVDRARKENTWFYWSKAIDTIERINNGVNKWAPWALSRGDSPSPAEGMMYQSWQRTSTYP